MTKNDGTEKKKEIIPRRPQILLVCICSTTECTYHQLQARATSVVTKYIISNIVYPRKFDRTLNIDAPPELLAYE